MRLGLITILVAVSISAPALGQARNLLFYGNSFTNGSGGNVTVPVLVRDIAEAAGQPVPFVYNASIAGAALSQHLAINRDVISTGLPPSEHWDYVILQDFSTLPTHIGNLASHRSSYVGLIQAVRAHSPSVRAIGFETWARAPGHPMYLPPNSDFPGGPAQMQQELREGYALSTADANRLLGARTSTVAPVGTAWERANWVNLHWVDFIHADYRGTLLAALVIYATIYHDHTVRFINIDPLLSSLSISAAEGAFLTAIVDDTTHCPADFNSDGDINPDDLADFITCFFLDVQSPGFCPQADFNTDDFRDPDDLADFVTAFFTGC